MNEQEQKELLESIASKGASLPENARINHIINGNLNHVVNLSSGTPAIQSSIKKKFSLILSVPQILANSSSSIIRCCVCKRIISYPCWYYEVKYAVNHFHYFVCFDKSDSSKLTANCRRI